MQKLCRYKLTYIYISHTDTVILVSCVVKNQSNGNNSSPRKRKLERMWRHQQKLSKVDEVSTREFVLDSHGQH